MEHIVYDEMSVIEDSYWWFRGKRYFVSSILSRIHTPKPWRILDIGCGTGGMTRFLKQYGLVTAIEKNIHARDLAKKKGIHAISATANNLPFKDEAFDIVTLFDVLYHSDIDETRALHEAYRVTKSDGHILITDCAHQWLWTTHDEVVHARKRYSINELQEAVKGSGFDVEKATYIFASTFPLFVLGRIMIRLFKTNTIHTTLPRAVNAILQVCVIIESQIIRVLPMPFGSSIFIVGKKPRLSK